MKAIIGELKLITVVILTKNRRISGRMCLKWSTWGPGNRKNAKSSGAPPQTPGPNLIQPTLQPSLLRICHPAHRFWIRDCLGISYLYVCHEIRVR